MINIVVITITTLWGWLRMGRGKVDKGCKRKIKVAQNRPATLIAYQPYECDRLDCKLANLTRYLHTWPLLHTGHASAVVAGRPWSNDQELAARRRPVSLVSDTQTRNDTPRSAGQARREWFTEQNPGFLSVSWILPSSTCWERRKVFVFSTF